MEAKDIYFVVRSEDGVIVNSILYDESSSSDCSIPDHIIVKHPVFADIAAANPDIGVVLPMIGDKFVDGKFEMVIERVFPWDTINPVTGEFMDDNPPATLAFWTGPELESLEIISQS